MLLPSLETISHIAGWSIAVVSLLMLIRFAWGDRAKGRRRCPKCWYDMSSHAKAGKLVCPECGKDAKRERGLRRTRRRKRWALLAIVMLIASSFIYRIADARQHGWAAIVPTAALAMMLPVLPLVYRNGQPSWDGEVLTSQRTALSQELSRRFDSVDQWNAIERQILLRTAWLTREPSKQLLQGGKPHGVYQGIVQWCLSEPFPDTWYIESMMHEAVWTRDVWVEGMEAYAWIDASPLRGTGYDLRLVAYDENGVELGSQYHHSYWTMVNYADWWWAWIKSIRLPLPDPLATESTINLELVIYDSVQRDDGSWKETETIVARTQKAMHFSLVQGIDNRLSRIDSEHITPLMSKWAKAVSIGSTISAYASSRKGTTKDYIEDILYGLDAGEGFAFRAELVVDGEKVAQTSAWYRNAGLMHDDDDDEKKGWIEIEPRGWVTGYLLKHVESSEHDHFYEWLQQADRDQSFELRVVGDPQFSLRDPEATSYWDGSITVPLRLAINEHDEKILVAPNHWRYPRENSEYSDRERSAE